MKTVLQKFIASSGYCSRRKAEELIKNEKVYVNGKLAELGKRVDELDSVLVEGKKIKIDNKKIYIILNKPAGYVCTNKNFEGEKNIFDLVKTKEVLHAVGRLDKNSRGLVLLTNDGGLTQKFTHPSFEHEKEYEVQVIGSRGKGLDIVKKFKKGIDIGDGDGVVKAKKVGSIGKDKFRIVLTEGKKRQIRRMFKAVGCEVVDLVRTRIGSIKLGNLKEGVWKKLDKEDVKILKS